MKPKRYTGRKYNVKKLIGAILILAGFALIWGGACSIDHDYITLTTYIIMMFSGLASLLVGVSLGRLI